MDLRRNRRGQEREFPGISHICVCLCVFFFFFLCFSCYKRKIERRGGGVWDTFETLRSDPGSSSGNGFDLPTSRDLRIVVSSEGDKVDFGLTYRVVRLNSLSFRSYITSSFSLVNLSLSDVTESVVPRPSTLPTLSDVLPRTRRGLPRSDRENRDPHLLFLRPFSVSPLVRWE